jgi:hypothetical protein
MSKVGESPVHWSSLEFSVKTLVGGSYRVPDNRKRKKEFLRGTNVI